MDGPGRRDARAEQDSLRRVARAVADSATPERTFALVAREVAGLLGVEAGIVWRFEGDLTALAVGAWGDHLTTVGTRFPLRGRGAMPRVWETGRPARVRYAQLDDDDPTRERVAHQGYRSGVAAPVRSRGRTWGAVLAATTGEQELPPGSEERLMRFAELLGAALQLTEDERELAERSAEQAALRRVATAVAGGTSPGDVFTLVCREAAELTGAAAGGVLELTGGAEAVLRASWRADGPPPPPGAVLSLAPTVAAGLEPGRPSRSRAGTAPQPPPGWRDEFGDVVSVPIMLRGRPWGLCSVAAALGAELAPTTERRLERFAELAATAIANAESQRELQERAAEQAALREVATAIAADAQPQEVFDLVCRAAARLLGVPSAGVMRLLPGDRAQTVANWTAEGHSAPPPGGIEDLTDHPGRGDALRAGGPARFAPGERSPGWLRSYQDVAAAPIILDGEAWGLLGVAADGPITAAMEARLTSFADLAGVAVASAEARRRSVDDAAALIAGGALDMDATLQAIVTSARRALNADRATCFVLDAGGAGIPGVHTTDDGPGVRESIQVAAASPGGRAMLEGVLASPAPLVEREDVGRAAEREIGEAFGVGAYLAIRLEHPSVASAPEGRVLGLLFISFAAARRFGARDRVAARSLASIAELALANARLHERTLRHLEQAERQAATDHLTGLANHRVFHERLREEAARARSDGRPLALALFDLDHFAALNALHGHETGDRVITEVAGRLAAEAGPDALLARIGGEEFAWLLPGADSLEGWAAADRARDAVGRDPLPHGERLTLSAGVAELSQGRDAGDLLKLAEGALYWAKAHGRDVTFLYSPEVVEELSAEERVMRLERSQALNAIRVLARAVDTKDPSTRQHSERVAELADLIARELGWMGEKRALLREAGLVHDVGKIGIPDSILFKPDRLTADEYDHVKQHAELGAQIVADVLSPDQVAWVRSHHERVDGTGYPDRLAGDAIPMGARILAVADAWDVMITARPYSAPISPAAAGEEFRRMTGTQFSPEVVAALERLVAAGAVPVAAT